jgi:hypothetical protein
MRLTARQAGRPEIDLRIDHQEDRSSMENASAAGLTCGGVAICLALLL